MAKNRITAAAVAGTMVVVGLAGVATAGPSAAAAKKTKPVVVTKVATGITTTGATLTGTAKGNPLPRVSFQFGTKSNLSGAVTKAATKGRVPAYSVKLTGLKPKTKYFFRIKGVNSKGTTLGAIRSFTTKTAPVVKPPVKPPVIQPPVVVPTTSGVLDSAVAMNTAGVFTVLPTATFNVPAGKQVDILLLGSSSAEGAPAPLAPVGEANPVVRLTGPLTNFKYNWFSLNSPQVSFTVLAPLATAIGIGNPLHLRFQMFDVETSAPIGFSNQVQVTLPTPTP